jgi:hypothetical protein
MKNLFETINTIRAKGVNTPRPGTDDTTVPTVQGDMPAGKVEPNPADNYKAVKNRMAQVKTKIIDETNGETTMPQDKVSASFFEAINQVRANSVALDEKKHKKNKHGHDAVGHEDADIDNDGDVDSSDKYLHNRRKAIGKAIAKEEVELDEVSTATLQRYKSAASKAMDRASDSAIDKMLGSKDSQSVDISKEKKTMDKRSKGVSLASNKLAKEEFEQIDELSKKTLGSYVKKAAGDAVTKAYRAGDVRDKDSGKNYMKALGRQIGISTATSKLAKEEVEELDELSKKTLGSYVKKASRNLAGREYKRGAEKDASTSNLQKSYKRDMGIAKAVDKLTKEEVEQIDELSKKTLRAVGGKMLRKGLSDDPKAAKHLKYANMASAKLYPNQYKNSPLKAKVPATESVENLDELKKSTLGSYVKRAAGSMAGKTAVAAAQASSSMKKSSPDITRGIVNRMKGITRATDKLAKEEVDQIDEVSDKKLDAYRQKAFADQPAGDDGSDKYRKRKFGRDLAFAKQTGRAKVLATKEEADLEEKLVGGQKKLDHNKNGKIDSHDFHLMRKKKMKEEVEGLDEISRDLARRYIRKIADKTNTGELSVKQVEKRRPGLNLAGKKAYPSIAGEPKVRATD